MRYRFEDVGLEEECIRVIRVVHRREAYRKSGLARQGIPGVDGFEEFEDWDMQESIKD